jgi:dolichol-phosphate mannosyltransferase
VLVDWRVHTYTCLYRAYQRRVIDTIKFESDGFLAGTELMVKGMLSGYKVAEFPAVLHRRAFGTSKAKLARTVLAHLRFQFWIFRNRLGLVPENKEKIKSI